MFTKEALSEASDVGSPFRLLLYVRAEVRTTCRESQLHSSLYSSVLL